MTEGQENTEQEINTEQQGTQEQESQQQAPQESGSMSEGFDNSTLKALSGLVDLPKNENTESTESESTEENQEESENQEQESEKVEGIEAEGGKQEEESSQKEEKVSDIIDNPIFGEKGLKLKKEEEQENKDGERSVEINEDVQSFLKKELGFEDVKSLKESFNSMNEVKQKYEEIAPQYENLATLIREMPPELYSMVDKFSRGDDWKSEAKQIKSFDYQKEAEEQNVKDLVDYYAQGKVTEEDWEEYNDPDGDPATKRAVDAYIEVSKNKFSSEKNGFTEKQKQLMQEAEINQKRFTESVDKTVSLLSNQIEGIDEGYAKRVSEDLRQNDISKLFFEEDGVTYREDAAARFAMAKDGLDLIKKLQHAASVKARNEQVEEILSRGADKPNVRGTKNKGPEVRPEVKKMLEQIDVLGAKKTTY